jgi:hypothetical protein
MAVAVGDDPLLIGIKSLGGAKLLALLLGSRATSSVRCRIRPRQMQNLSLGGLTGRPSPHSLGTLGRGRDFFLG